METGRAMRALQDRIEVNPKVMMGKPVIRGTRVPVELILRKQGRWEQAVEHYLAGLAERDSYRRPVEAGHESLG